jgi:multimeric flavodoxin WrbA
MKILGIVGSPRKKGNTELMMQAALAGAREAGAETEIALVAGKNIAGCDGCEVCVKTGICRIKDDMVPIYAQMKAADGIIFGTPVYYGNVTSQAKAVIDRCHCLRFNPGGGTDQLADKVGGALVVTRRVGAGSVRDMIASFFLAHEMVAVRGGIGYARLKGEIKTGVGVHGLSALEEGRALGKRVVRMVNRLSGGR